MKIMVKLLVCLEVGKDKMDRKNRRNSYNPRDPYDMPMVFDEPSLLNNKGKKKRRSKIRRGLL